MLPIGPTHFQRLEDFPSFISCIKCFGRPIIPPLLTPSYRHELKQLRIAAANKEAELLRRKNELLEERQGQDASSTILTGGCRSGLQSTVQENCALWYPSSKDTQEGSSVAISKFPTSAIYSSVHTGAIVCSNVIESSHAYAARMARDSLYGPEPNLVNCIECSHNNMNLECSLCQEEYNQSFLNGSFTSETSPEVPCRTYSLLQQNVEVTGDEVMSGVDETECESLPTVICNQKYVPPDTDSESNVTYMTQSTDLEKYMELSSEFSPDNSTVAWDSKSSSQQYTLSRSDDASSETMVNTENELTPCASTMAELTDNIEDELSNAEEIGAASSSKEVAPGTMKRAHSVDSYMKILQTCAKSINVKKSLSEPFYTNSQERASSSADVTKVPVASKTGLLIKEDSKESEESKEMPEKDASAQENTEISSKGDTVAEPNNNVAHSFQKKHVRQNSYTLDQPSSVLMLAHVDCACNFDAKCASPHCSALKDENVDSPNLAFTKEKVDISVSLPMKKLPVFSLDNSLENHHPVNLKEGITTSAVIDIFPVVTEDISKKSDSGNNKEPEIVAVPENACACETENAVTEDDGVSLENLNLSNDDQHKEYIAQIYEEFRASHETRVREFHEEQLRQWLKIKEEFEKQEKILFEKLKLAVIPTDSLCQSDDDQAISNQNCSDDKISEDKTVSQKELPVSNSSISSSDQMLTSGSSSNQNSTLTVHSGSPQSICSPSKTCVPLHDIRALKSPSKKCCSSDTSPSSILDDLKNKDISRDFDSCTACNFSSNRSHAYPTSEAVSRVNGFPCTSPNLMPRSDSLSKSPNAVAVPSNQNGDIVASGFCDNSRQQYLCCRSSNGCCDYDIATPPDYVSKRQNFISNSQCLSCHGDAVYFQNNSHSSGIQSKSLDSDDFANYSFKTVPHSSKKSPECVSSHQTVSSTFGNGDVSSAVDCKRKRNNISKEKSKLPLDNILSLCSKNGSLNHQKVTANRRIVDDPYLMKKFEKLPAFVKGYLTRRLLETERVQNLVKTLQDTARLIAKMPVPAKGDSVSQIDEDFQRGLIVQLTTTWNNIYDIFCTISTKERMNVITESRNFRLRKKNAGQSEDSNVLVLTKVSDPAPSKKPNLSSATLKSLQRKRFAIDSRTYTIKDFRNARSRSAIDMRTYTIDDLPSFRGRTRSNMSSKSHSVSPSSIYKSGVGVCMKRKSASAKSSGSRHCLPHKWVP